MPTIPNEETRSPVLGAFGTVVLPRLRGIPSHYRYWVVSGDGTLYAYHSIESYNVGDCIRIYVPKAVEGNKTWFLGEAAAEIASDCK